MDLSQLEQFFQDNSGILGAIAAGSLIFVLLGAALGPVVIARLPEDHFTREVTESRRAPGRGAWRLLLRVLRNIAGFALLLLGLLLLVLPGQGLLTMIAGLALMDFPMKRRLMQRILGNKRVRAALDWLRRKTGKEPFHWE